MHSPTIQATAGSEVDRRAKQYADGHGMSYGDALRAVLKQDPTLAESYRYGDSASVRSYADNLPPARKRMAELQADPELARRLASYCVDALARRRLQNVGPGVPDSLAEYRRALDDVRKQNPSLARCEQDGFIAADDFKLLAMLIPSVAGAVAKGEYSRDSDRCPKCGETRAACRIKRCVESVSRYGGGNDLDRIHCLY